MYQLRWATQSDYPFIASSYLKSYQRAPAAAGIRPHIYFSVYKDKLEKMIKHGQVLIACSADDQEQILGYTIFAKTEVLLTLHYVYVKYPFRQYGLGKAMVTAIKPEFGQTHTVITHLPKHFENFEKKYKLVYNPALAEMSL